MKKKIAKTKKAKTAKKSTKVKKPVKQTKTADEVLPIRRLSLRDLIDITERVLNHSKLFEHERRYYLDVKCVLEWASVHGYKES